MDCAPLRRCLLCLVLVSSMGVCVDGFCGRSSFLISFCTTSHTRITFNNLGRHYSSSAESSRLFGNPHLVSSMREDNDSIDVSEVMSRESSTIDAEVAEALAEQGLSWQDVLQQRETFLNSLKIPSKKDSMIKDMSKIRSKGKKTNAAVSLSKVRHKGITIHSTREQKETLQDTAKEFYVTVDSMRDDSKLRPHHIKVTLDNVKLVDMLGMLVETLGYQALFKETGLRCFSQNPSITSSLKVLRQKDMEWARLKIQKLYLNRCKL